jgi:hypothetical protein
MGNKCGKAKRPAVRRSGAARALDLDTDRCYILKNVWFFDLYANMLNACIN